MPRIVAGPATALLITGILWTLVSTGTWIRALQGKLRPMDWPGAGPEWERVAELTVQMQTYVQPLVLLLGLLIVIGAVQMLRLRCYGLAVAASLAAMTPCSGCCLIGLPFGIWALVVLCRPEVRLAFRMHPPSVGQ